MEFAQLRERYRDFVQKRDWKRFHTPQNLAQAVSVEADELLENFLWMNNPTSEEVLNDQELLDDVREEMADVIIYLIGLANQLDIDLLEAVSKKMTENEQRFDEDEVEQINDYLEQWQ